MKAHSLPATTVLAPKEKPASSAVRYQLPEPPKVSPGMVLGLVVFIAAIAVVYGLFGR
jgi:hypothetical protein